MSKARILIVEDEQIVASDIKDYLEDRGYRVTGMASTGEKAISMARDIRPDLVLMDIVLKSEMNGIEAAERIVEGEGIDIPIIYLTAYMDKEFVDSAMRDETYAYLLKPVNVKELLTTIDLSLYKHKLKRELQEKRDELERTLEERTAELREAEGKYHVLFREASDGIVLIDSEDGRIVECNRAFERLTGRGSEELEKMKVWGLRPPDKVDAAREMFMEVREKGMGGSSTLEFQRPDGEIVPVEFRGAVLKIGGKDYIQSIVREIEGV